jgi:DHA1 family bicyclomycin/chloramphenicol resistance-like MFS transporter
MEVFESYAGTAAAAAGAIRFFMAGVLSVGLSTVAVSKFLVLAALLLCASAICTFIYWSDHRRESTEFVC